MRRFLNSTPAARRFFSTNLVLPEIFMTLRIPRIPSRASALIAATLLACLSARRHPPNKPKVWTIPAALAT